MKKINFIIKDSLKIGLVTVLILTFTSCGITKRGYEINSAIMEDIDPSQFEVENDSISFFSENTVIKWWEEFNDPVLDSLIERARYYNKDVEIGISNYYAARAMLKSDKFDRYPQVTVFGGFTRTRLGENIFVPGLNPIYSQYDALFRANWELDFFGRVSNRVKGSLANQQAAQAELQNTYVLIFSEVARNYIELLGAKKRLDVAQRNLEDQRNAYELTVNLSDVGKSNTLDVSRASALLENTKATIPSLKAQIEILKNSLCTLLGVPPGKIDALLTGKKELPALPGTIPDGDIYEALRRRPDIRMAENLVRVQIAQYNISVAELYPKITFNGNVGLSAIDLSSFGKKESFTWTLFPSISWAAFNLGKVKQNIDKEDAETLAALGNYEKTVLEALEEIRNDIVSFNYELERQRYLTTSFEASKNAADLAQQRYKAGLDSFIDFLGANGTLLSSENELALSETATFSALIKIYKSSGGGWQHITEEELKTNYQRLKNTHDNTTSSN